MDGWMDGWMGKRNGDAGNKTVSPKPPPLDRRDPLDPCDELLHVECRIKPLSVALLQCCRVACSLLVPSCVTRDTHTHTHTHAGYRLSPFVTASLCLGR